MENSLIEGVFASHKEMDSIEDHAEYTKEQAYVNIFGQFIIFITHQRRNSLQLGSKIAVMMNDIDATAIVNEDIEYLDMDSLIPMFSQDEDIRDMLWEQLQGDDGYDWLIKRVGPVKIDNIFYGLILPILMYRVAVTDNGEYWERIKQQDRDKFSILLVKDWCVIDAYDYDDSSIIEVIDGEFPNDGLDLQLH